MINPTKRERRGDAAHRRGGKKGGTGRIFLGVTTQVNKTLCYKNVASRGLFDDLQPIIKGNVDLNHHVQVKMSRCFVLLEELIVLSAA